MSSYYVDKITIAKALSALSVTPNSSGVSRVLLFIDDQCIGLVSDILMYSPSQLEISNISNSTYDDKALASSNPFVLSLTKGLFVKPVINNVGTNGVNADGGVIISVGVPDNPISNSVITIQYEHAYTPVYKQIIGASLIYKVQDGNVGALTSKETLIIGATNITELIAGKSLVYQTYLDAVSVPLPQQIGY